MMGITIKLQTDLDCSAFIVLSNSHRYALEVAVKTLIVLWYQLMVAGVHLVHTVIVVGHVNQE